MAPPIGWSRARISSSVTDASRMTQSRASCTSSGSSWSGGYATAVCGPGSCMPAFLGHQGRGSDEDVLLGLVEVFEADERVLLEGGRAVGHGALGLGQGCLGRRRTTGLGLF